MCALKSKSKTWIDGDAVYSADLNQNFDDIYNEFNGNITAENLADSAITNAKIANTTVGPEKLNIPYKVIVTGGTTSTNNATPTKCLLTSESKDPNNNFADNKYTVPVTGYYLVCGMVDFDSNASGQRAAYIYVNGTAGPTSEHGANPAGFHFERVSDILFLTQGDYVELYGYQSAGGTLNIKAASLAIHLLSRG